MGRVEEAAEVWTDRSLPCETPQLLAVEGRSWQTNEALWCARATLLGAQGDLEAAGELADAGWRVAAVSKAMRIALRCLGLSMAIAHQAGREDRALARLAELLRAMRHVDYYRSLADHRDISCALLRRLLAANPDAELREAAESALAHLGERSSSTAEFSPRELDVLAEVRHGLRNKEIATFLKITEEGVRYHLRNIYRKAGVSKRHKAVRYAEAKGVLV